MILLSWRAQKLQMPTTQCLVSRMTNARTRTKSSASNLKKEWSRMPGLRKRCLRDLSSAMLRCKVNVTKPQVKFTRLSSFLSTGQIHQTRWSRDRRIRFRSIASVCPHLQTLPQLFNFSICRNLMISLRLNHIQIIRNQPNFKRSRKKLMIGNKLIAKFRRKPMIQAA